MQRIYRLFLAEHAPVQSMREAVPDLGPASEKLGHNVCFKREFLDFLKTFCSTPAN